METPRVHTPEGVSVQPKKRRKHTKLIIVILVLLVALAGVLEFKRRTISQQLQNLTVRMEQLQVGNKEQNEEEARDVVAEVRRLIDIPEDIEPTVATIIDVEVLRERNPFYKKAENGDYLVVTPDRAILYSAVQRKILDVVPVRLAPVKKGEQEGEAQGGSAEQ